MGATSGAETTYPSGAPEVNTIVRVAQSSGFCIVF